MTIDANRLRVLVEIAHAGSIAAAAQRMSFTASALSQQVAKLERELGGQLLERHPGGVRLTPAGQALVGHGEVVLGELRAAEHAVRAVLGAAPQTLAIGAFATAAKVLLPDALAAFRRDHPRARLSLLDLEPPAGYGLVTSGDLDLLITHRYPGMPLPGPVSYMCIRDRRRGGRPGRAWRSWPARTGSAAVTACPTASA